MPTLYVAKDGQWHKAVDAYIAKDGAWHRQKIRMVGVDGRWVESHNIETAPPNEFLDVYNLNYRAGGQLQGDLKIQGFGLTDVVPPEPRVGAFYSLRGTIGDYFDNFGKLHLLGTEVPLPTLEDGAQAYAFDATKQQAARTPLQAEEQGYYDLLGHMGNDANAVYEPRGKRHWELGGKVKPKVMPTDANISFLYYAGTATQNLAVWYDKDGTLFARFKNGDYSKLLQIPTAIALNQWTGFVFRHRPTGTTRYLELQINDGRIVTTQADLARSVNGTTYTEFAYWVPAADLPIQIAYGTTEGATGPATAFFLPANTSASITISNNGRTLSWNGTAYRGAMPSGDMLPNTGKYYIEVNIANPYDMHMGFTNEVMNTEITPGQYGWCINTINGRKFAKQTGGGTNWTGVAATANSVYGLLYDSDTGAMDVYINGVKQTQPFAAGFLTGTQRFIIGGRATNATTKLFNPTVQLDPSLWAYKPAGITVKPVPFSQTTLPGGVVYATGVYKDFFIRSDLTSGAMTEDRTRAVLDPALKFEVVYYNIDTGDAYQVNEYILVATGNQVIMSVPDLPDGNYNIRGRYPGYAESTPRQFTVKTFQYRTTPMKVDFGEDTIDHIRANLMVAHKQWGGINGGVVTENVVINRTTGLCEVTALGDLYNGAVKGVDRYGEPSGFNTRIGGGIVTRDYFGPASYRIVVKPTTQDGVCNAFWSFHYEEGYPGSALLNRHLADGLHLAGTEAAGYYTVRNHEIDIEFPTALKTDHDQEVVSFRNTRFNTWLGEARNWDAKSPDYTVDDPMWAPVPDPDYWSEYTDDFFNHGVNLGDGQFHELRYDWHLGDDPRVEFYVDGTLYHTIRTHIPDIPGRYWAALWFPSANTHWAGKTANWAAQRMYIKSLEIIPFADEQEYARPIVESYPYDVFRDFRRFKYE